MSSSSNTSNVGSVIKTAPKPSKKIDMGAATNFGRDEIGINSPTHRNTHAEEDLFGSVNISTTTTADKNDLLDDIFKTCATTNNLTETGSGSEPVSIQSKAGDDFFNPRMDETQEFGDFASAFGASTQLSELSQPDKLVVDNSNDTKKGDFADFGAAFDATQSPIITDTTNSANLLFAVNIAPTNAQQMTSESNQKVGDLLSDLDGLTLDVSVPTGKFSKFVVFFCYFFPFTSPVFFPINTKYLHFELSFIGFDAVNHKEEQVFEFFFLILLIETFGSC